MSKCRYNCFENRTAEAVPEYADISGIGVIIGYTVTAGLTVAIITVYYFLAHQPELNPFRSDNDDAQTHVPHKPHPVDKLILDHVWKLKTKILNPKKSTAEPARKNISLEKALLKCVLRMSDLQILTGLSILISGYSQLRCGLSMYHWQILVYLTWFCSLTHLSCLTFLRNYLCNHPGERLWRLIGMGVLVTMLIIALLPTGNYGTKSNPADYAICSFRHLKPIIQNDDPGNSEDNPMLNYASMIISILLMGLGFLSRIVRLHRGLSIGVVTASRDYLSERARKYLRQYYEKHKNYSDPSALRSSRAKILFFYRPALAVFLAIRAVLDLWSSLILEVWWLVASFAWGIYNLALSIDSYSDSTTGNKNWTFGQIAPVILLLAPVLSVFEALFEPSSSVEAAAETNETTVEPHVPSRTETMEIAINTMTSPPENVHDDPDHDFYQEAWFRSLILFLLCGVIISSINILFVSLSVITSVQKKISSKGKHLQFLIPSVYVYSWLPFAIMHGTVNFILFSLLLEHVNWKLNWKFPVKAFAWCVSLFSCYIFPSVLDIASAVWFSGSSALYIGLSCMYVTRTEAIS